MPQVHSEVSPRSRLSCFKLHRESHMIIQLYQLYNVRLLRHVTPTSLSHVSYAECLRLRGISVSWRQYSLESGLDLEGQGPGVETMLLGVASHGPVVIDKQVALPDAANLALLIDAPRGVDRQLRLEDLSNYRARVCVGESRAPNHGISVNRTPIRESQPRGCVAHRFNAGLDSDLALGQERRAADVDIVAASALDQIVHQRRVGRSTERRTCLARSSLLRRWGLCSSLS
ncbi:hypothetical protein VTK56DRAFT_6306 [Thermocarpiscus australiensis]